MPVLLPQAKELGSPKVSHSDKSQMVTLQANSIQSELSEVNNFIVCPHSKQIINRSLQLV